jgi:hypothetical protein
VTDLAHDPGAKSMMAIQQEIESAKNIFRRLVEDASHESIIELLVSLRAKVPLSVDDTGWALWNLCDRCAIQHDAKRQYMYQSEFHEWSKTALFPCGCTGSSPTAHKHSRLLTGAFGTSGGAATTSRTRMP